MKKRKYIGFGEGWDNGVGIEPAPPLPVSHDGHQQKKSPQPIMFFKTRTYYGSILGT
jgi:hypothetical protein